MVFHFMVYSSVFIVTICFDSSKRVGAGYKCGQFGVKCTDDEGQGDGDDECDIGVGWWWSC